jgi:hypothetical protein
MKLRTGSRVMPVSSPFPDPSSVKDSSAICGWLLPMQTLPRLVGLVTVSPLAPVDAGYLLKAVSGAFASAL